GVLPHLDDTLQTFDLFDSATQSHRILKQPVCAECGEEPQFTNGHVEPLTLQSQEKRYTQDGGHRSQTPQETIEKYSHHVSHISGAVSMLERTTAADDGVMHVYVSGANVARGAQSLGGLRSDLRESSAGKGSTDLQAKASALCEGLERYSGLFRGDEPYKRARMTDLGDAAIHPNDCMRFSEKQFDNREQLNDNPTIYNYIPQRFDPEWEIDWTPVWSLTRQEPRYLPTAMCYFDAPQDEFGEDYCIGCSNGNAAGNNLEEAIMQGFFELVERDAVGLLSSPV
ncbi:MAG: TOMM precursor leader peptide-binding protein, partial [Myxococcales bacterium]|nr:TOMM precursor leader peptide-binding protein [Myxococcales bacterium]